MNLVVDDKEAARFERGFKTWAENTAIATRARLGLRDVDPLPPSLLAKHLGVRLWTLSEVPGLSNETLVHLRSAGADEWSAITVRVGAIDVVVFNPTHSAPRQASNVMHELSHIIRGHEPAQVLISEQTGIGIRSFNKLQEAEANWLAGCLLLPRAALVSCAAKRVPKNKACGLYGVSDDLYTYRTNITGVNRQFRATGRA